MSSQTVECAIRGSKVEWHKINWAKCTGTVKRLQARIVKAVKAGQHNKVKALQWVLTNSFSAKALAVRRVTQNKGKKTPGVDGVRWPDPKSKSEAVESLSKRGYRPKSLRRIYIPKSNGKKRPLGIPTMKDRAMQALYLLALEPIAETKADPNSYGFRTGRSLHDAIEQGFIVLARKYAAKWIFEADIKSCFDKIDHQWLLDHIPMDKQILGKWLKSGYMDKNSFYRTEEGSPQGGIISPALMNMTLDGLESLIDKIKRTHPNPKVNYIRYADDFIVTADNKELLEYEIAPAIREFLIERGLSLSEEKTKVTHIDQGFDFLGKNIRKYRGKLLIKPAKKGVKTFLSKVRTTIKENKTVRQEQLIKVLNPIIYGWASHHRHVVAKALFCKLDHEVWKTLWQWAKRRHPNKTTRWIKNRYFIKTGNRDWIFGCKRENKPFSVRLAGMVPIKRHVKIRMNANPFDPEWEAYFEKRWLMLSRQNHRGREKHRKIFNAQNGKCVHCGIQFRPEDEWEIHHIVQRVEGGKDTLKNLRMLHPNCHRQIHNPMFKGSQPAPKRAY